jgi:hypothetical protein
LPLYQNVNGTTKEITEKYIGVSNVKREVSQQYLNISGTSKLVFQNRNYSPTWTVSKQANSEFDVGDSFTKSYSGCDITVSSSSATTIYFKSDFAIKTGDTIKMYLEMSTSSLKNGDSQTNQFVIYDSSSNLLYSFELTTAYDKDDFDSYTTTVSSANNGKTITAMISVGNCGSNASSVSLSQATIWVNNNVIFSISC